MRKISSGQRFIAPGEAPADLGISERFRAQIVNTEEASRVIQNATNLFQTADAFMQNSHEILNRMSELSIAAFDSSKNQGDRLNLDLEFQQLKTELARISEAGKYNGLQINGKTAVSVWDAFNEQVVYYQPDGSDKREVAYVMSESTASQNGLKYAFQGTDAVTGDFTFSTDGKSLYYYAQVSTLSDTTSVSKRNTLMKLDISSDTINYIQLQSGNTASRLLMSANYANSLKHDEEGRLWTSYMKSGGGLSLSLVRESELTVDKGGALSTNAWAGDITMASGFGDFAINSDHAYYIDRDGDTGHRRFVSRDLFDINEKAILVDNLSAFSLQAGASYSISHDGRYVAYEGNSAQSSKGTLFVLDTAENKTASMIVGTTSNAIVGLGFDYNNNIYWSNTGSVDQKNSIQKLGISRDIDGDPVLEKLTTLVNGNVGHFGALDAAIASTYNGGLNIGGGSPATNYEFQVGPDASMFVEMSSADVRLFTLGISDDDVRSMDAAQKAIASIANAISIVANQRAVVGSEVSRLAYTLGTNESYNTNISAAESRLRDVDIAQESAKMTSAQILAQSSLQILQFNNGQRQSVLGLLSNL